jgi:hypothetical protein
MPWARCRAKRELTLLSKEPRSHPDTAGGHGSAPGAGQLQAPRGHGGRLVSAQRHAHLRVPVSCQTDNPFLPCFFFS